MKVYFWEKDGEVFHYAAATEAEAKRIAEKLGGFTAAPVASCAVEEWESAGSIAHLNGEGSVVLGIPADVKTRQEEIEAKTKEAAAIRAEIAARDYRVTKATRLGTTVEVLYPGETAWYNGKVAAINAIETRLAELRAEAVAA
jgi:hypothetical protein